MKNFNILMLIILASLTISCSTTFYSKLNRYSPYLRSSSATITNYVLSEAVSEEDRKKRANTVLEVASLIEAMTEAGEVSVEEIANKVSNIVPKDDAWSEFAAAIIFIYADIHAQIKESPNLENVEKIESLKKALNKIAAGCRMAAERFD